MLQRDERTGEMEQGQMIRPLHLPAHEQCADSLPGDLVQACLMPVRWTMSVSAGDSVVHRAVFGDSSYRTP